MHPPEPPSVPPTHRAACALLTAALGFCAFPLMGQKATTYSVERDGYNNTSAADRFPGNMDGCGGRSPGNPPAGNVSKLPIRQLLYSGATTRIYAHFMPWFCTQAKLEPDNVVRCNGHVLTGYDSNDPQQVRRQIEDMIVRGIDGLIVDWYGPSAKIEEATTRLVRAEAEKHPGFEFAIMEDAGAFRSAPDKVQTLIADLNYAADNYYVSPAYMRRHGRPVLFFFVEASLLRPDEWDAVRLAIRGNPLFIFQDSVGFTRPQSDGGFAWIGLDPHPACRYLDDFYEFTTASAGGKEIFGSSYQGFDDTLATWPIDENGNKIVRKLDRRCGRTWLCTFESANDAFDSRHQLPNLQIVTWNDYDEGTEIESGIDNCLALSASIDSGGHLHWVPKWNARGGTEETIDHYRIFSSPDGENLTLRKKVRAGRGPRSVDLATLGLPAGPQTFFVQAVGKPSIRNHIVTAGRWSPRRAKAAAAPAVVDLSGASVVISSPATCATPTSPLRVIADEDSAAAATGMQIYLDGVLVADRPGVEHVDELVSASPGPHQIAVKAWYGVVPGDPAMVDVVVGPTITISSPAPDAGMIPPVHVIADETTPATASVLQVYLDGTLVSERAGEHLDEMIPAAPGPHQIAAKAWYPSCPGPAATVGVTVLLPGPPVIVSSPAAGATVSSPIRIVGEENTARTATDMQVYVDEVFAAECLGAQRIDEIVTASPGFHQLAVKAWYADGSSEVTNVNLFVASQTPGGAILISSPGPCATANSPLRVVADENTSDIAAVMQIYVDGVLLLERRGVEHLDEIIPASPGPHWIAVKTWYDGGCNRVASVYVTVGG